MKDLMTDFFFLKNNVFQCAAYYFSNPRNNPYKTFAYLAKIKFTTKTWIDALNREEVTSVQSLHTSSHLSAEHCSNFIVQLCTA